MERGTSVDAEGGVMKVDRFFATPTELALEQEVLALRRLVGELTTGTAQVHLTVTAELLRIELDAANAAVNEFRDILARCTPRIVNLPEIMPSMKLAGYSSYQKVPGGYKIRAQTRASPTQYAVGYYVDETALLQSRDTVNMLHELACGVSHQLAETLKTMEEKEKE